MLPLGTPSDNNCKTGRVGWGKTEWCKFARPRIIHRIKNVRIVSAPRRLVIPGTLNGWGLRLLKDLHPEVGRKKGDWLSHWSGPSRELGVSAECEFGDEPLWVFPSEAEAKKQSDYLRTNCEIETQVVKVGNP